MFDLEKRERAIIIFLVTVLLLGLTAIVYRKAHNAIKLEIKSFSLEKEPIKTVSPDTRGVININEAGLEELMKLKRIGKTLAERIIDYRNSKGRFNSVSEIKNVKGVGDSTFEDIKNNISVE